MNTGRDMHELQVILHTRNDTSRQSHSTVKWSSITVSLPLLLLFPYCIMFMHTIAVSVV